MLKPINFSKAAINWVDSTQGDGIRASLLNSSLPLLPSLSFMVEIKPRSNFKETKIYGIFRQSWYELII